MAKMIETRQISQDGINLLENLTPARLEKKYRHGDCIHFGPILFVMVSYSKESSKGGQSNDVTYWSELYDLEINLDWVDNTVIVQQPGIDWKANGF